jgi:cytochrome c biogenesis protein CcdA
MAIPFIVIMLFADFLLMPKKKRRPMAADHQKTGGALLVITGILMFIVNRLNG